MALDYPIKNKKDFYNYISDYDEDFSKRLPEDFDALAAKLKDREFPIRLGGKPFGFSFLARHLMGEVNYMLSMYDDLISTMFRIATCFFKILPFRLFCPDLYIF